MARDEIRFLLNGESVRIANPDPTLTLLDYLREHRNLRGSKEGCREGDCGACTVAMTSPSGGVESVQAVNACIMFLPAVDGTAITTVEGVARPDGALDPVQAAMVDCHGSQCGFCTPGFVVSLHAAYQAGEVPDRARICEILAGNLCRCTGYGPIIAAATAALHAARDNAAAARPASQPDMSTDPEMLRVEHTCAASGAVRRYAAPRNLTQVAGLMRNWPDATFLAGGTDIGLWVTKQQRQFDALIDLTRVKELQEISVTEGGVVLGAAITYSAARDLLCGHYPGIATLLSRIASEQIRNRGTIGGNIANGSPIGDMPPALIALGASVELIGHSGMRELALEDYFIAYGQQDRQPDEVLARIRIPALHPSARFQTYKISKRFDQDISAVCGAFYTQLDGETVRDVRICFGGMAGTPRRALQAEGILRGSRFDQSIVEDAAAALAKDFTPLTDLRASAAYRMLVAQNLLRKFHAAVTGANVGALDREGV